MTPKNVVVRGEPVADILAAMQGMKIGKPDTAGMVSVRGAIGDSALRALMRVEAELLLEDADALDGSLPQRTEGQRRADALAQLGHEVALALGFE